MKRISMVLAVIVVAATATLAFAGPWGPGRGWGSNVGMFPLAMADLDLTAEQTQAFQGLQESLRQEITPLQNDLFGKRAEMRLMWSEPNPDQEQIMAKQREILELQQRLQEKATQQQLAIRSILTPEQWSRMTAFGPGPGRGPGGMIRSRW